MNQKKQNYQKQLETIISCIHAEDGGAQKKPTLLLHACCGPCSSYVVEYLSSLFDITVYFYNPNIHPAQEYIRRKNELEKFLSKFEPAKKNNVKLIIDEYNPEDYFSSTNVRSEPEFQHEPEKGERCRRCYEFRMKKAFAFAAKNHFDWFTTTLSISPHKDAEKINVIGKNLEAAQEQLEKTNDCSYKTYTKFLPSDFKKKGGFLRSIQLSEEYGLWRQDYCGCIYSMGNKNYNQNENLYTAE